MKKKQLWCVFKKTLFCAELFPYATDLNLKLTVKVESIVTLELVTKEC